MRCQCPKLTPLQSRLLASVSALALLFLIYWSLSDPRFAYAGELAVDGSGQLREGEDHNWHRIPGIVLDEDEHRPEVVLDLEARSQSDDELLKRVAAESISGNNIGIPIDLSPGNTTLWEYSSSLLQQNASGNGTGLPGASSLSARSSTLGHVELRRRDDDAQLETRQDDTSSKTIYISANTCEQPTWIGNGTQTAGPPQLTLYVSLDGSPNIGPDADMNEQTVVAFTNGSVNASIDASGDSYMAVYAPTLPSNFSGSWNYELAVSLDDYFYSSSTAYTLLLLDTDDSAALLVTDNLTDQDAESTVYQEWADLSPPFILFAINLNISETMGLENSFCGLQNVANKHQQIQASTSDLEGSTSHVQLSMTSRGLGSKPKEQFYISDLNTSSQYTAFLAMQGNSTASGNGVVGGGGTVYGPVNFTTKNDGNCQLIHNLSFCDDVAYAVPANPTTMPTISDLAAFYENYTYSWYQNFNYSLQQIPCNTTSDAQYSLVENCTDCAAAYKEWLCAVSIPRCEDFSGTSGQIRNVGQPFINNRSMLSNEFLGSNYQPMSDAPTVQGSNAFLQTYASSFATNQSRNTYIDTYIQPGPYREILPCEDLCWNLMRSCPAALNLNCPYKGRGLEVSYGKRGGSGVSCNYPGAYYGYSDARRWGASARNVVTLAVLVGAWLVLG